MSSHWRHVFRRSNYNGFMELAAVEPGSVLDGKLAHSVLDAQPKTPKSPTANKTEVSGTRFFLCQ